MTIYSVTPARRAYWASMTGTRGLGTPRWKGPHASVGAFHKWITAHYGKADRCEHPGGCDTGDGRFDWCLKKGKKYSHRRGSYIRFCRTHHRRYDLTPKKVAQVIKNLIWYRLKTGSVSEPQFTR